MRQANPTSHVMEIPEAIAAVDVSPVSPDEAADRATVELDRILSLLDTLAPSDWEKPTYCTLWNVRQVVAHVVGALSAYADWDRLLERSTPWTQGKAEQPGVTMPVFLADLAGMPAGRWESYRELGFTPLDAVNQFEVDQRAGATPAELIAELKTAGPPAIENRRRLPDVVRSVQLPVVGAKAPVAYLIDVIYPRDMWMHRMELALSTGRAVTRTGEHDGRLTALVMRDLSRRLNRGFEHRAVVYRLGGPDGGAFRFGPNVAPEVVLTVDAVDFHLLASGRKSATDARALTTIAGDDALAERVLADTVVVY